MTAQQTEKTVEVIPLPDHDCAVFECHTAPPTWRSARFDAFTGHQLGLAPLGTAFGTGPLTLYDFLFGKMCDLSRELVGDLDMVTPMMEALDRRQ